MATGVMISQLGRASGVQETDYIEIERNGESYCITVAELMDYLGFEEFIEALSDAI